MNPLIPRILAACSLTLNPCAAVAFVMWLTKLRIGSNPTNYGFHVTELGPPNWLIAALVLSILGVLSTCVSLLVFWRARRAAQPFRSSLLRVLTGLAILGVTAPAIVIIPGSAWLLPGAQEEARREALIHNKPEIDRLLKVLPDENYYVRRDAAQRLAKASWLPDNAIPKLMKAAARDDGEPSFFAVQALTYFRDKPDEVIPGLVDLLDGPDIALAAGEALGGFGKPGVDALLQASKSGKAPVRQSAAHGLGRCSYFEEEIVARLTELLRDENGSVRAASAMSLGILGAKSESALPALQSMADDPDPQARGDAGWAATAIASKVRPPD